MTLFNQTVTIFNHYFDSVTKEDRWNKQILKNCMWQTKVVKTVSGNEVSVAQTVSLTVPYNENRNLYISAHEYKILPNDLKKKFFTLDATSNKDVCILGHIDENSFNYNDVKKKYGDNVCIISAVSDNTHRDRLKHWKIVGK